MFDEVIKWVLLRRSELNGCDKRKHLLVKRWHSVLMFGRGVPCVRTALVFVFFFRCFGLLLGSGKELDDVHLLTVVSSPWLDHQCHGYLLSYISVCHDI